MFYERLTMLCKERGISISALLNTLGLSKTNNKNWREGSAPSAENLERK